MGNLNDGETRPVGAAQVVGASPRQNDGLTVVWGRGRPCFLNVCVWTTGSGTAGPPRPLTDDCRYLEGLGAAMGGFDESDQLAALVGPLPGTWCAFAVSAIPQSPTGEVQSAGPLELGGSSEMLWGCRQDFVDFDVRKRGFLVVGFVC